ncbi:MULTISPECIES: tRNA (adenosine(37)-N6)-threonylcarbamoyltransferase complex ATPase subunit type 1 TsaE [unclassified Saccharopolyspora]|uniref:tRNA (adenosine(37)-N6)-threonylcarbamoyltransferase complex ATPase subunit type 1 TsaE n=1 Tax=unclassified Saccharopolyspora TaxID=2646250 RepID=UPI001CD4F866|nr:MULTISPECIES: tRNA (adenosine(37)-N6)-threonylcarbamoyltransferase complex ATPase subunit type 1 TsaE [unclassified Saccharopolyspora]MCA1188559.1 tRNA (adenosine(37)-N6)-threonylcarbamoyltransferase complex ATPase subunit type 1 TsaE [Saccharopolyspora sp. 6T]MCA1193251.1 tRNA (adenosine(37)-N6)-threonylcarbamoyltransferase complex ATPase subunit type 1 TsaE [Saccharopolyspora sp. 6V]MCA1279668.1 tRNA (adenosine(37)-N6)-threonylcarbamoyltransferase complex ATPase subunit type 1 TsaE [Sacchar
MSTVELATPEAALEFGRRLGAVLRAGDLVVLDGPLGAGKTVLAKGIAAGMGVTGQVTSPTFVIARVHHPAADGPPLVHVDAYRLGGLEDVDDLDLDTDLTDAVVVVEWGAEVADRLADEFLLIRLHRRADDVREVELEPHGADWPQRLAAVRG